MLTGWSYDVPHKYFGENRYDVAHKTVMTKQTFCLREPLWRSTQLSGGPLWRSTHLSGGRLWRISQCSQPQTTSCVARETIASQAPGLPTAPYNCRKNNLVVVKLPKCMILRQWLVNCSPRKQLGPGCQCIIHTNISVCQSTRSPSGLFTSLWREIIAFLPVCSLSAMSGWAPK